MSRRDNPLPDTPYKGLMPYSEEDAPFFFGREAEREIITANLLASRLTLLYGASGVGKSSVLRAGVAYHLRQAAQQNLAERGRPEFAVVVFSSWRDDPIVGLADRVRDSVAQALETRFLEETGFLDPTSRALAQTLQAWTERVGGDLLIILDQFEEYFLYHPQEDGEGTFAVEFPRAVNRPDLRVSFLISIREDSLAKLDRFKGRIPNLFDNYLRIEHLDREAARAAIEKPIEQYNRLYAAEGQQVSIEPKLVEAVLRDPALLVGQVVLGEAGRGVVGGGLAPTQIETPYLQLVMTRLWEEEKRAGSRTLRLETLDRLGGAESIVQTHLDATMRALSANEQDDAARVFHFLVTPSGTKIAHTVRDLAHYSRVSEDELGPVLNRLSEPDVRILRPIAPPPDQPQVPRYEIFHDVLAPAILAWRARYVQAQERAEAEKQLARERRRVTRLRLGLIGLSLLLMVMAVLAFYAVTKKNEAEEALWMVAMQDRRVPYFRAIMRHGSEYRTLISEMRLSAAFSPDGKWVVTAGPDNTPQVWGEEEPGWVEVAAQLRGHKDIVYTAVFSPDSKWVITASRDNTARVWEAATGKVVAELHGHTDWVLSAAFSPDGQFVVTASRDHTARVWEARTGKVVAELHGHTGAVHSAAFSPDGQLVATASWDHTARVWEARTGKVLAELRGHTGDVPNWRFGADGQFGVCVYRDGEIQVLGERQTDTSATVLATLPGHTGWVTRGAFSPDGKWVATVSADDTARVWEARTGRVVAELQGHTGPVISTMFSPDGKWVVTASVDGTARVWEAATGKVVAELRGHRGPVTSAAFSPDGKWVVTASTDRTARVWEASTGKFVVEVYGHTGAVTSAAFSSDGRFVLTAGGEDLTARMWNVTEITAQSMK